MKKVISYLVLAAFLAGCVNPPQGFAQALTAVGLMSQPGAPVTLTAAYVPAHLKGMTMDVMDPFKFDFIVHRGDKDLTDEQKKAEYPQLIKYFLAALAVPDMDQWVNLSPYEEGRIIPDGFGRTEMGRDLLAQDYLLKQLSASLTDPDTDLGKKFWAEVYARTYEQFGTTDIPTDTFNKVWITPDKAVIYEKGASVYVLENHLKVQVESDYLAMENNRMPTGGHVAPQGYVSPSTLPSELALPVQATEGASSSTTSDATSEISKQIMRQVIIPEIEKEVNQGASFAPLRQIYSSMLLATWYKRALKESILGKVYADSGKVNGVDQDPANNQQIYEQYVQAFKQGVFNMIREEVDPLSNEAVTRKYFSGGTENRYTDKGVIRNADDSQASVDFAANIEKMDRVPAVLKDASVARKTALPRAIRRHVESLKSYIRPLWEMTHDSIQTASALEFMVEKKISSAEEALRQLREGPTVSPAGKEELSSTLEEMGIPGKDVPVVQTKLVELFSDEYPEQVAVSAANLLVVNNRLYVYYTVFYLGILSMALPFTASIVHVAAGNLDYALELLGTATSLKFYAGSVALMGIGALVRYWNRRTNMRMMNAVADHAMNQDLSDTDLPRIIEMEIVRNDLLKNTGLYPDIAKRQDDAYNRGHGYVVDPSPWTMEKNAKQIYRNMAGVFATLEGVALIAERDGRRLREVAQDVVQNRLSKADERMLARMAHATWLSTQFDDNFSTQRFLRPVVMPSQQLSDDMVEEDLKQIRSAAVTLQDVITRVVEDQLDTEMIAGLQQRVGDLVTLIKSKTALTPKDEARIRKTALTVFYAHREQKRAQGTPYATHPLGVAELAIQLFGDSEPFLRSPVLFVVAALLHDVREDQNEFFEQFRNFARNVLLQDQTPEGQEKLGRFNQVLLMVRMLSKLTPDERNQGTSDELLAKYFEVMINPRDFYDRPGMPAYDDVFIRGVQLIKLCDILYNAQDMLTLISLADSPEKLQAAYQKIDKAYDKILRLAMPILVMRSTHLEKSDVDIFFREMTATLERYKAQTGEAYVPMAASSSRALDGILAFQKEYNDRARSRDEAQSAILKEIQKIKMDIEDLRNYEKEPWEVAQALPLFEENFISAHRAMASVRAAGRDDHVLSPEDIALQLNFLGLDLASAHYAANQLIAQFEGQYPSAVALAATQILIERMSSRPIVSWVSLILGAVLVFAPLGVGLGAGLKYGPDAALNVIGAGVSVKFYVLGTGSAALSQAVKWWRQYAFRRTLKAFTGRMDAQGRVDHSQMGIDFQVKEIKKRIAAMQNEEVMPWRIARALGMKESPAKALRFVLENPVKDIKKEDVVTALAGMGFAQEDVDQVADQLIAKFNAYEPNIAVAAAHALVRNVATDWSLLYTMTFVTGASLAFVPVSFVTGVVMLGDFKPAFNILTDPYILTMIGTGGVILKLSQRIRLWKDRARVRALKAFAGKSEDKAQAFDQLGRKSDQGLINGGIDMNSAALDMEIRRDGQGVPLPISQQDLEQIRINGLVPVILDIQPASMSLFAS